LGQPLTAALYLLQDLLCAGVVIALGVSLYRRFVVKPERLRFDDQQAANLDASIIIGMILVLIVFLFGARAVEYRLAQVEPGRYFPQAAFISVALSGMFAGLPESSLLGWHSLFWWGHTLVILGFLVYIPFSKHLHILGAIPNIFFRRFRPLGELTKLDLEDETVETYGVSRIEEFTWKQLLDLYACTECGRCSENCPANLTGKPLSPKETIHHLKKHLLAKGKLLLDRGEAKDDQPLEGAAAELRKALVGEVCLNDEIWSCTTCGNCMEHCPVFIEHIQKYVDMRRYLVLMESRFPPEVQTVLRNWETNSNPWGLAFATRGDWARGLQVQTLAENPEVEYLFYVGCTGSFEERGKKVTAAMVRLLHQAGVSFGILGAEEKCCGETARRIGNEYLFQSMAAELAEIINGYGIKKIITTCPHGYNCLKNEYPQFGGNWEVYHHTEFLARLLGEGLLLPRRLDKRLTFHDSCYLGRYNGIYEEPRGVLKSIPGLRLLEMERRQAKSFCCGAGGGRMWMEETLGEQKINEARTDQALALDPELIAVSCPFCAIMLEDGLKAREKEEAVKVYDIAELLAQALETD